MTARNPRPPVASVGGVDIYAPTATSPYFRLKWREPDGSRGDTTGGRDIASAREAATEIDARLAMAAGPHAVTTLRTLVGRYIAEATSPHTNRPWQLSYRNQVEDHLNRTVRHHEDQRAMDVTRQLCDTMRAQGGTDRMVRQNTSALRGFLLWGYRHDDRYFTATQAELLPERVVMPKPSIHGTAAPSRRGHHRAVGEHESHVREEDAPGRGQVVRLGQELDAVFPAWGGLAPELAANCGPRWGEQFQLTAYDAHPAGCPGQRLPHVHIDWQIDPGAPADGPGGRRTRPKGNKTRVAPVPRRSFTGYPLLDALAARVDAALAEQAAGTNPQALLFPAARGGMLWYSGFEADQLLPAMARAEWPLLHWHESRDRWSAADRRYTRVERDRTMALLPWHSLRHRFARVAIDQYDCGPAELMALGGWENELTVKNRYYRSGKEHTESGLERFSV